MTSEKDHRRSVWIYLFILAFAAMAAGLSDQVYSNFFKDAYDVSAVQRGLIEFPRETPGVLVFILLSLLSSLGDIRVAMVAQILSIFGLLWLGLLTPPFAVMLVFLLINSFGGHLWMPLQESIGMSLIRDESRAGSLIGRFKGVTMAFSLIAALVVFVGFRTELFSFTSQIKTVFLIAAALLLVNFILLFALDRKTGRPQETGIEITSRKRLRLVFRKEYKFFYLLAIVFGVQKQIMFVYAPWVLIDLLDKKTDTLAMLGMIGGLAGIFFVPALGRWIDRFGIKKMLYADALSFVGVYIVYGILSAGFSSGWLMTAGLPVLLAFALFIIDRMSMQMGIIRSLYLRSIIRSPSELAPTLTTGQAMDHVVSIICATGGGLIWSIWGPQYIFFLAAGLSLINFFVAVKVKEKVSDPEQPHTASS